MGCRGAPGGWTQQGLVREWDMGGHAHLVRSTAPCDTNHPNWGPPADKLWFVHEGSLRLPLSLATSPMRTECLLPLRNEGHRRSVSPPTTPSFCPHRP